MNQNISTKLMMGFVMVALIAAVVGGIAIKNIYEIDNADTELYEENLVPISYMGTLNDDFQRIRVNLYRAILAKESHDAQTFLGKADSRKKSMEEMFEKFKQIPMSEAESAIFNEMEETKNVYDHQYEKIKLLIKSNQMEAAMEYMSEDGAFGKASRVQQNSIENLVEVEVLEAKEVAEKNTRTANKATIQMIIAIVGNVILALFFAMIFNRMVAKPIKKVTLAAKKIAKGDTHTEAINYAYKKDEIGALVSAFESMQQSIKEQSQIAKEIAKGNFDVQVPVRSENDELNQSLQDMLGKINLTFEEVNQLIQNVQYGKFLSTKEYKKFDGGWKEIVLGIDRIIHTFVNYFDALPIILMTVDNDYNITYLNQTGADMFATKQSELLGKKCYNYFDTDDCNTERCICHKAMVTEESASGENICHASGEPMHIYYSGIPMTDSQGNITGAFEVVLDQTQIKLAQKKSDKQAKYQMEEVNKLISNLEKLSKGELDIKTTVADGDEDTNEIASNFKKINNSLESSTKEIKSYMDELSQVLDAMSNKNFKGGIDREYLGDFITVKDSINYIIEQFNTILSEINSAAEQVESGAGQVAASSQNLSQGASEQAGSVEEISATITQVTEQTKENAANAMKANELSLKVKEDALNGNSQMGLMLKSMNDIKDTSNSISNIIKVIDEIAFQTNILALNAAVEAARAGEHGKGFAVVAEEVRNLAARSAKAAKETTELIDNSINKVNEGYNIANDTAEALEEIVKGVSNAVDVVSLIADASTEQANAILEINQGVEQISQVTQTNTATSEESASASEEMAGQAQMLKRLIQDFELKQVVNDIEYQIPHQKNNEKPEIFLKDDLFGKY